MKKKPNHKPMSCPICTECYADLDMDYRGIYCVYGGPFIGYKNLVTKQIEDREGNKV